MKLNKVKSIFVLILPLFLSSCLLDNEYCVAGNPLFQKNEGGFSGKYDNSKSIVIPGTKNYWQNSGVSVVKGQGIKLNASGVVILAQGWGTRTDIGDIAKIIEMQAEITDDNSDGASSDLPLDQDSSDIDNQKNEYSKNQYAITSPDGIFKNGGKGERYCISAENNKSTIVGGNQCQSKYNSEGFFILTDSNCNLFKPIQDQSLVFTIGDCSDNFGTKIDEDAPNGYYGYTNDISGVTCSDNKWTWTNNWEFKRRGCLCGRVHYPWWYEINGPYSFSSNAAGPFCDSPKPDDYPYWIDIQGNEDDSQEFHQGGTDRNCWNRNGYGLYYSIYTSDSTVNNDTSNLDTQVIELYNASNKPTTTSPLKYNYDGVGLKIANRNEKDNINSAVDILNKIAARTNDMNISLKLDQDTNLDKNNQLIKQKQIETVHANDNKWVKEKDLDWVNAKNRIDQDNSLITTLEGASGKIAKAAGDIEKLYQDLTNLGFSGSNSDVPKAGGYTVYVKARPFYVKDGQHLKIIIAKGDANNNPQAIANINYNDSQSAQAPIDGTLWFMIDDKDYSDNSGSYTVTINTEGTAPGGAFSQAIEGIFIFIQDKLLGTLSKIFGNITCTGGTDHKDCTSFNKILKISLVLYLSFFGISFALGITKINQYDFIIRILKISFIIYLTRDEAWYYFSDVLFPAVLKASLFFIGAAVGTTDSIHPFSFLDPIMNVFFDPATWFKLLSLIFSSLLGVLYFVLMLYGTAIMLYNLIEIVARYAIGIIGLGLVLSMSPIFLSFLLFKQTKYLFDAWIKSILKFILEPVILIIVTVLICSIIETFMSQIFSFTACVKCAIPIIIGLPFISALPPITLFCLPFPLVWGISNSADTTMVEQIKSMTFLFSFIPFTSLIGFVILVKFLEHAKEIVSQISQSILGYSSSSITSNLSTGGGAEAQNYATFKKITGTDSASKLRRSAELSAKAELVNEHDKKAKEVRKDKSDMVDKDKTENLEKTSNELRENLIKDLIDGDKDIEKSLFGNDSDKSSEARPESLKPLDKKDLFGDDFESGLTGDKKNLFSDNSKGSSRKIKSDKKDLFGDDFESGLTGDKKNLFSDDSKKIQKLSSEDEGVKKAEKDLFGDDD